MTNTEADNLIATLPKPGGLQLYRNGDEIVMAGGSSGTHSLSAQASSGERLLVHWRGYVENNGQTLGPSYSSSPQAQARRVAEVGQVFDRDWKAREQAVAAALPPPRVPTVGEWVSFPSKSAKSGWRKGQVVRVTGKRVLLAFRFNWERESDRREGLKFDPSAARTTWRKLTEIKAR